MRTLRGGGRGLRAKLGAACGGLMRRAGCWQAVVSAGQLVQPLVVRALVLAVSEDGARAKNAALRVTGYIAALTIIVAFAQQRQPLHLATRGRDAAAGPGHRGGRRGFEEAVGRSW